jgi:hypothetical protein
VGLSVQLHIHLKQPWHLWQVVLWRRLAVKWLIYSSERNLLTELWENFNVFFYAIIRFAKQMTNAVEG